MYAPRFLALALALLLFGCSKLTLDNYAKLKTGMAEKEVKDLLGKPTDEGQYVTGKAFIPFYFGSDRIRWEMAYRGEGRLIFAQQGLGSSAVNLIWIIHNANDRGYR